MNRAGWNAVQVNSKGAKLSDMHGTVSEPHLDIPSAELHGIRAVVPMILAPAIAHVDLSSRMDAIRSRRAWCTSATHQMPISGRPFGFVLRTPVLTLTASSLCACRRTSRKSLTRCRRDVAAVSGSIIIIPHCIESRVVLNDNLEFCSTEG